MSLQDKMNINAKPALNSLKTEVANELGLSLYFLTKEEYPEANTSPGILFSSVFLNILIHIGKFALENAVELIHRPYSVFVYSFSEQGHYRQY